MSEMILIDEGSHDRVIGVSKRMLINPDELSIAGQVLNYAKQGLHRDGYGDPTQQPLDVINTLQSLYGYQQYHSVSH